MRLLLAEDDRGIGMRLRDELVSRGFAVDWATGGVDAQHLGDVSEYDVAVLDLGLPERPGLQVLMHWRARGNSMPVLILTARDAWHEKVEGFRAGADDYLAKPFHFEELHARVQALIRRRSGRVAPVLSHAGVVLDEDRQQALCDGRPVALSGVEFRLLRYLMSHAGKVRSKSDLASHVYDGDSDHDSNIIEAHISHLRAKIGRDLIVTRRGQGYVFGSDG